MDIFGIGEYLRNAVVNIIVQQLQWIWYIAFQQVNFVAPEMGKTPAEYSPQIFQMIRQLSDTVILPIAGIVISFICIYELIQMLVNHNNMKGFDFYALFMWMFKTAFVVIIVSNAWNIVMAFFDLSKSITEAARGMISIHDTIFITDFVERAQVQLDAMNYGQLLLTELIGGIATIAVTVSYVAVFLIIIGRFVEIYLMTSVAPLPLAATLRQDSHNMGINYLKSIFALALQAFLIMVCLGIYSLLLSTAGDGTDDLRMQLLMIVGYSVLLCVTLAKTGRLAKSILGAH